MNCLPCCNNTQEKAVSRKSLRKSLKDYHDKYHDKKILSSFANISFKTDEDCFLCALLCVMVLLNLNIICCADSSRHRYISEEINKIGKGNISSKIFSFRELCIATSNFNPENMLGEGGFGRVYRGNLESTNQVVAVKQLDRNGFQGNREFLVEVLMLSLLSHPHLVNLVGYCADGDQRILVYEHMANGSLEDHLLDTAPDRKPLDWNTRMKIAGGAAKGLEYLHEAANPPVIYRDFKASNILLDKDFNAKLSDFGLAKLGPTGGKTHVSTRATPLFKDRRKFTLMADPLLQGNYPLKALYQALAVAAMCLQEEAATRPLMSDVVTALEFLATNNKDEGEGGGEDDNINHGEDNNSQCQ
ncbi:hypothetical protein JRO89_XS15G0152600 [Xanthoceras sorbifolium]|uniref:Protein kinase domain-containing protein n=1 Tax=Xanthoceras sorbifolium TaxID=99658 RepID=A0ABQ8H2A6_9ROSI|nr:hypothetical protein JRO89_XS15G0152600 [Xanthoceras sorbifolium]